MKYEVLITDDDKMVLFIQEKMMKASSFFDTPKKFAGAHETLEYLDENQNEVQNFLVFLDINMPYMNGWEFLQEIDKRDYSDKVKVIMVTSSIDEGDQVKAKNYPRIIDFLIKPVNKETLLKLKENPNLKEFYA
ncbi:MAG: response regulator [Bacteroidota bacterium]